MVQIKSKIITSIVLAVILSLIGLGFKQVIKFYNTSYYENFKEVKYENKFQGKIKYFHNSHGTSFVTFNDDTKLAIPWAINESYDPKYLYYFLKKNDVILKSANSDTLFIYREDKKYYFILKKRINE